MPAVRKSWTLTPQDTQAANYLASQLRLSPVVAQLLVNRQVTTAEAARQFLDCPMAGLLPPKLLPGVPAAAAAILEAVQAGRRGGFACAQAGQLGDHAWLVRFEVDPHVAHAHSGCGAAAPGPVAGLKNPVALFFV